ncbi:MAG: hypothetical protein H7X97_12620, partial [Opitutaceae bacterium]|nr:hypothetical protein [Verrucomicrobiales bacterium]
MGARLESPSFQTSTDMHESGFTSEQAAAPVRGGVLLLEDDAELKDVIKDYLVESGYSVTLARNGVEGIRRVLDEDFSVILCDM